MTPRDGALIFRDIVGKLDVLRVECDKCGRRGSYRVDRLIERYGIGYGSIHDAFGSFSAFWFLWVILN